MNRPAFATLALAGLVVAFQFPAHVARATANAETIGLSQATPDPTPSGSPGPAGSPAPSPTSIVPLVDISVSNASPSPSPTPTATESATPSPAPHRRRRNEPAPTDTPSATPEPEASPTQTPVRKILRHLPVREPSPEPTATPESSATPESTTTPARATTDAPENPDITSTAIPTQPPTPRPVAPLQPSIPDSLDDQNVMGILSRPIPQLSQFGWLNGTWNAQTFEFHGGGKQRNLGKNTYVFANTMKDRWIFGGDGKGTDYFYITYDPFARQWALSRVNENPAYGIWLSRTGWHANEITFDSTYSWVNGRQYRRRVTFVHTDARHFTINDQEQLPTGAWLVDQTVELTKQ